MFSKSLFLIICSILLSASCYSSDGTVFLGTNNDSITIDLGKVQIGYPLKGALNIINATQEMLIITKVQTSCGCTLAKASKNILAPGQSCKIDIVVTGKMRVEKKSTSMILQWSTSTLKNIVTQIQITGEFSAPFKIEPDFIYIETQNRNVNLFTKTIAVKKINSQVKFVKFEIANEKNFINASIKSTSTDEYEIKLKIKSDSMFIGSNRFTGRVIGFDKNLNYVGENQLSIVIKKRGDISSIPSQLIISYNSNVNHLPTTILLESLSMTPFVINKVYSDLPSLSFSSQTNSNSMPSQIVTIYNNPCDASLKGNIYISTSSASKTNTLCIPTILSVTTMTTTNIHHVY